MQTGKRKGRHIPDRIDSQPGADEENCKHGKQEVAEDLTFGVVGHLGRLGRERKSKRSLSSTWKQERVIGRRRHSHKLELFVFYK